MRRPSLGARTPRCILECRTRRRPHPPPPSPAGEGEPEACRIAYRLPLIRSCSPLSLRERGAGGVRSGRYEDLTPESICAPPPVNFRPPEEAPSQNVSRRTRTSRHYYTCSGGAQLRSCIGRSCAAVFFLRSPDSRAAGHILHQGSRAAGHRLACDRTHSQVPSPGDRARRPRAAAHDRPPDDDRI